MPKRVVSDNFVHLTPGDLRIVFAPPDPVHPFAVGFTARAEQNGTVAAISGRQLEATMKLERGGRTVEFESATLTPTGNFVSAVIVDEGRWAYRGAGGRLVRSDVRADRSWHQLLVSHYTARGQTLLFVDGKLAGTLEERLEPSRFVLGGTSGVDARNFVFYRSAMNADEAAALHGGLLLQASLEVYSPLDNVELRAGADVANLAQSMTAAQVQIGNH